MEKSADNNLRVLIVDDEPLIALDIAAVVEDAGCEVIGVAGSVRKALGMLERWTCDVAVLDVNLNGESAEPVAAALRRQGAPFLVISGYAGRQLPGALRDAPFITKPYSPERLMELLNRLTAKKGEA